MQNATAPEPKGNNSTLVHTTMNYGIFKNIEGNRDQSALHIGRIKKSMRKNYLFTIITVNEKFEIIDGQHRFEAIKALGLPVNYVICTGYGINEVHVFNQNAKVWSSDDYLDGYCDMGKEEYLKYKRFKETYKFGHNECMAMLSGNNVASGDKSVAFRNGDFKIIAEAEAYRRADNIVRIAPLYDGYKRRVFIYAMLKLFNCKNFVFEEFLQKLRLQPSAMSDCVDVTQYLALIETIYNFRRKEKINLRYVE